MGSGRRFIGLLFLLCLVISRDAWALEFVSVRWGFNGTIQRHRLNLCSIELINPDTQAFQGRIELRSLGLLTGDTPLVEPNVFIGAGETRVIQFTPYITSHMPEWELRWGNRGGERAEIQMTQREVSEPVVVQLRGPASNSAPIQGLEVFEDAEFPIGAPGTETLGTVVLDHVPRWDEVRRRAFRDWLGRGGKLFLLNGRDGAPLNFPSPLEELNILADRFAVGQGTVVRHNLIQDVGEIAELASLMVPTSAEVSNSNYNTPIDPKFNGQSQLIRNLQARVRPNHNWALIFFLAVIYLLMLFPGIWLFSRKRGDFRVTYTAVLGTVVLFSWLYSEIGKRGYDENTGLREMLVIQPLGNKRMLVDSYANLFVTEGGQYSISPRGEAGVVSLDVGERETARFSGSAEIQTRPQTQLVADIPPFSSCSFFTQSIIDSPSDYSMTVDKSESTDGKLTLEARLGTAFPAETKVYFVSNDDRAIKLNSANGKWTASDALQPSTMALSDVMTQGAEAELQASQIQVATGINRINQYGYYPNPNEVAAKPTQGLIRGYLIALAPAPAELLLDKYNPSGLALFVVQLTATSPVQIPTP